MPLDVKTETALFYADESLDPASNPAGDGSCAALIDPGGLSKACVQIGGYGTITTLDYTPGSRRLRFCFWEFDHSCSHAEAETRFLKALGGARAALGKDATFANVFPPEKANPPAALLNRRAASVPRATGAPEWSRIPFFEGDFTDLGKPEDRSFTPAAMQTRIQAAWDEKYLHLRVNAKEDRMDKLVTAHSGGEVWMDDCVEIFLDAGFNRTTYCQFIVNAVGETHGWDTRRTDFTKEWISRVGREKDGWWAELTLPLAALGIPNRPGTVFSMSVCRERRAGGGLELSTWTPPAGFNRPKDFGVVVLGDYADSVRNACAEIRSALAGIEPAANGLAPGSPAEESLRRYRELAQDGERLLNTRIDRNAFLEWTSGWETLTRTLNLKEVEYGIKIRQLLALD
jgi:hypothetical protein